MNVITPTVGRNILYCPAANFAGYIAPGPEQRLAGFIVAVHGDRAINIAFFDAEGNPHRAIFVRLLQPGDPTPTPGAPFAEWMPYQKGQAAKNDDLEPRVAALESGYKAIPMTDAVARTPVPDA